MGVKQFFGVFKEKNKKMAFLNFLSDSFIDKDLLRDQMLKGIESGMRNIKKNKGGNVTVEYLVNNSTKDKDFMEILLKYNIDEKDLKEIAEKVVSNIYEVY